MVLPSAAACWTRAVVKPWKDWRRSTRDAQPDVSANMSFLLTALQFFVERLAQVEIMPFRGVRHVGFERAGPLEERIASRRAYTVRHALRGQSFQTLALLRRSCLERAEHLFRSLDRQVVY